MQDAFDRAVGVLKRNRVVLDRAAARLLDVETLDQDALVELTKDLKREPSADLRDVSNDA